MATRKTKVQAAAKAAKTSGGKAQRTSRPRSSSRALTAAEPALHAAAELEAQEKKELTGPDEPSHPGRYFVPYADIYETADSLYVLIEMPGVAREGLDIELERNVLSVEGRVDFANYTNLRPVYTEYNVGHFSRRFRVPATVDAQGIKATLANGVLTLELSKSREAKARRIPVQ